MILSGFNHYHDSFIIKIHIKIQQTDQNNLMDNEEKSGKNS